MFTRVLIAISIAFVSLVGQAQAITFIDFDQLVDGGTLSFSSGGPLVGTDLTFDVVHGIDTPMNSGVSLFCDGSCLLNFETGDLLSVDIVTGEYVWDGGGFYTLTGDVWTGPGGTGIQVASGTLVDGTFTSGAEADILFGPGGAPLLLIATGTGLDVKNPDLATYFGFTSFDFIFANTNIASSIEGFTPGGEGSFSATVVEADLVNFPAAAAVPEPGSVFLLGAGMIALGAYGRRKLRGPRA